MGRVFDWLFYEPSPLPIIRQHLAGPAPRPKPKPWKWRKIAMGRVIVESPYKGDGSEAAVKNNLAYLKACILDCIQRGEVPFASHGFFPQYLDEDDPEQRRIGIEMGYDFWEKADKVIFYMDCGMSPGMKEALARAFQEGKTFERRYLKLQSMVDEAEQSRLSLLEQELGAAVDLRNSATRIAEQSAVPVPLDGRLASETGMPDGFTNRPSVIRHE